MRQFKMSLAFVFLLFTATPALRAQLMKQVVPGEVRVFRITAENYEFNPFTVIVKPGDKVRLIVTAVDRDYAFKLKGYHIEENLKKSAPATINFTATKPGTFTFSCPKTECRLMHRDMKGTLVVRAGSGTGE